MKTKKYCTDHADDMDRDITSTNCRNCLLLNSEGRSKTIKRKLRDTDRKKEENND